VSKIILELTFLHWIAFDLGFLPWMGIVYGFLLMGISTVYDFYLFSRKAILFGILGLSITFISMFLPILFSFFLLILPINDILLTSFSPLLFCVTLIIIILLDKKRKYKQEAKVRKKILELATTYTNFKLKNVAKMTGIDKDTIIKIVNEMIAHKEIYAEYFSNSKKFAFNKRANLEEIDNLMELYRQWEEQKIGKKI
jgi:hypothetical protein